eukprot:TRINITY_DN33684_c0_g5_i1.p1 TRINITY_DN33684_c0_g5~~TRINITY_DN33684_c0_g5_i1.p1  ORF type:complete len:335 (+),score=108.13 TRINITY_DN33684_c0_g5_i1:3-1007(+)
MKYLAVVLFAFCALALQKIHDAQGNFVDAKEVASINADIIDYVNNHPAKTWTSGPNDYFKNLSVDDAKKLMGTVMYGYSHRHRVIKDVKVPAALPATFDSRTQWPNCPTIGTILDQGRCGSCWAFGATEAISDRFCIESNGTINVALSEQDLTTCDFNDDGCQGGDPYTAWSYVQDAGLVTSQCQPYTIPTCPPASEPCLPDTFVNTPNCNKKCSNGDTWHDDLHLVDTVYGIDQNANKIATEIMTNGPVEAAFSVYEDFLTYKTGVYQHTTGSYLGGHAVKIIGWGTESGTPYWLVANSWTTTWGDAGFFKIRKGNNECGIESGIVGGTVKWN